MAPELQKQHKHAKLWASIDKSNQTLVLILFPVYKIIQMKNTISPTGKLCFLMAGCFLSFPETLILSRSKQMLMIFSFASPFILQGYSQKYFLALIWHLPLSVLKELSLGFTREVLFPSVFSLPEKIFIFLFV